jgi:CheY-like chemotaxis protein
MAEILALVDDLFFQTKMVETAKQLGVQLRTCSTADALLREVEKDPPKLVVVDLNGRNDPIGAIARLKAGRRDVPLLGFFSHVQADLAERARAAGCRDVMPRSKFTRDLATILGGAKSEC